MTFPVSTTVCGPWAARTVLPCPVSWAYIYRRADMNPLIFHPTGFRCLSLPQEYLFAGRSLETAVKQDKNRIIHGCVFTTSHCLAAFYQFHSCLCNFPFCPFSFRQRPLTLLSHHLHVIPFSSTPSFPFFLFPTSFPFQIYPFLPLFSPRASPALCQVVEECWERESLAVVGECAECRSLLPSRQLSAVLCDRGDRVTTCFAERRVFDVALSFSAGRAALGKGSRGHLHTVIYCQRRPVHHPSQRHVRLQHQCTALRFSINNMAGINFPGSVLYLFRVVRGTSASHFIWKKRRMWKEKFSPKNRVTLTYFEWNFYSLILWFFSVEKETDSEAITKWIYEGQLTKF